MSLVPGRLRLLPCISLLIAIGTPFVLTAPPMRAQDAGHVKLQLPAELQTMLEQMSGGASEVLAESLGLPSIAGKPRVGPPGEAKAPKLADVAVGATSNDENEPTVVANPTSRKRLVAGSHSFPIGSRNRCVAYTSADSGATWSPPFTMPQLTPTSGCSDPALAYAPDGSRVHYSYMDIKSVRDDTNFPASFTITTDLDIVVSHSNDNGTTWARPVIVLDGDPYTVSYTPCPSPPFPPGFYCGTLIEPGYVFDKNWVGTHNDAAQSDWVYVTATRFDVPGFGNIAFARSADAGLTYGPQAILETGGGVDFVVVQGSRPTGGAGGDVLVAWYNSGTDGYLNGRFRIRTRYSSDHGATWEPTVTAVEDASELPFWLGPHTFYKRWAGSMFPDVAIDSGGTAHIVYTHDPVANGSCPATLPNGQPVQIGLCSTNPEDGDIRYIASGGPGYTSWSAPVTVNDDGTDRAQGYPAMIVQQGGERTTLHVIWEDTRLAPALGLSPIEGCLFVPIADAVCDSPNKFYDIFYSRLVPGGGAGFSASVRVSEASSIQDFVFGGDYIDLAATATSLFGIWTDRRHHTSIFPSRDNVMGSRIIAGGGTSQ